jgi:hypothetical protein
MLMPTMGLAARLQQPPRDRRESDRVPGPFDAWRVGVLDTPVRIYDISLGGCFVNAMHDQKPGVQVLLRIQLPGDECVEVKAETLYTRPDAGFAVRFIDVDPEVVTRLERALARTLSPTRVF